MAAAIAAMLILMSGFLYLYLRAEVQRSRDTARVQAQSRAESERLLFEMRRQSEQQQQIIDSLQMQLAKEQGRRSSSAAR